jgi:flagellar biogenesis protein FliO
MLDSLFGGQLGTTAKFAIAFILVLGLIGITALIIRRFGAGGMPSSGGGRGRQPRLAVLDSAVVDAKRRLVLIRRDNSEHLLLIGGPTDVVVETNIVRSGAPMPQMQMQGQPERRPAREARGAAPQPQTQESEYESSIVPEPMYDEMAPAPQPAPRSQPAAYSPPPPLPPRVAPHPSATAPMPQQPSLPPAPAAAPQPASQAKLDPQYADMAQRLEAALRKPATAPAPKTPETRPMPQAAQPRPAPTPQTRPMPATPAPAVSQPAPRPGPAPAQSAPNPFDSLEAEMASLLGQDKKR